MGGISHSMASYPRSPGLDFSGRVVAVGRSVEGFNLGDNVFGRVDPVKPGALAEYVVAPSNAIAVLPKETSFLQAGAAPTSALASYQAITPHVKTGDKVFLNGGSGGLGAFGIQIAKTLGCHVTVTCSSSKVALCKQLGADEIIDYGATDVMSTLRSKGKIFTLVVDNVGDSPPDLFKGCKHFLPSEGHFKYVGGGMNFLTFSSMRKTMSRPSFLGGSKHKLETLVLQNSSDDLAQIAKWMREGKVRTVIDAVYNFEELPDAYTRLKQGSTSGKIVISMEKGDEDSLEKE